MLEDTLRLLIASNPAGAAVRSRLEAHLRGHPTEFVIGECVEHLVEWLGTICAFYYQLRRSTTRTVDEILASQHYAMVLGSLEIMRRNAARTEVVAMIAERLACIESRRGEGQDAARDDFVVALSIAIACKRSMHPAWQPPVLEVVLESAIFRSIAHCRTVEEIADVLRVQAREPSGPA